MNLKYALNLRLTPKTYLFTQLLILLVLSLSFTPLSDIWKNLLLAWSTAISLELLLNALRKKVVHLPDAALITATIIAGVLATSASLVLIVLAVATGIFAKHFIKFKGRHLFNPANLSILVLVFFFGQNIDWWIASNASVIILLGLYIGYKIRRLAEPLLFLTIYFLLLTLTSANPSFVFLRTSLTSDFSIYFFAFVMLIEPQTSAWSAKGRYINSALTALLATTASFFGLKAPLILSLAVVNLLTPLVNRYTKSGKHVNKVDVLQTK